MLNEAYPMGPGQTMKFSSTKDETVIGLYSLLLDHYLIEKERVNTNGCGYAERIHERAVQIQLAHGIGQVGPCIVFYISLYNSILFQVSICSG